MRLSSCPLKASWLLPLRGVGTSISLDKFLQNKQNCAQNCWWIAHNCGQNGCPVFFLLCQCNGLVWLISDKALRELRSSSSELSVCFRVFNEEPLLSSAALIEHLSGRLTGPQSGIRTSALPNVPNYKFDWWKCIVWQLFILRPEFLTFSFFFFNLSLFHRHSQHNEVCSTSLIFHLENVHSCRCLPPHGSGAICSELSKRFKHIRSSIAKHG